MSKAQRRYIRTIVLGVMAMAALIWAAVDQFGISWEEIGELFLGTVIAVALVIAAAAIVVALWLGLRRLFPVNQAQYQDHRQCQDRQHKNGKKDDLIALHAFKAVLLAFQPDRQHHREGPVRVDMHQEGFGFFRWNVDVDLALVQPMLIALHQQAAIK